MKSDSNAASTESTRRATGALRSLNRTGRKSKLKFAFVTIVSFSVIAACIAVVALMALPFSTSAVEPRLEIKTMPVTVQLAQRVSTHQRNREFTGIIKTARASELAFERTGSINQILVTEGQYVPENHPVAILDTRNLNSQKNQLIAQKSAEQARLDELVAGPRQETIAAAKANVTALTAQKNQAQSDLNRRLVLKNGGAISDEEFSRTESNFETSVANLESAQKQLDELLAGTRKEQVNSQKSVVKQIEANLNNIEIEINKSTLIAPYAGKIASRFVDEGATVNPGSPVVRIVESDHLEAWIGIPTLSMDQLFEYQTAAEKNPKNPERDIKTWRMKIAGRLYDASLEYALPEVDPSTRTRQVVFRVDASIDQISPGQIARLQLSIEEAVDGFWVPTAALAPAARGTWSVFVAAKSGVPGDATWYVIKREVEIISANEEKSLVRGTLEEGDFIIATGIHRIAVGQPVKPDKSFQN